MRSRTILAILSLLLALAPVSAQAQQEEPTNYYDNYLTGYLIRNFGGDLFTDEDGDTRPATQGFGVAYTFWGKGLLSAEVDFTYNPEFFGSKEELGSDSNLLTFTVNGVIGPWIRAGSQSVRPYGVIGGGLMRSKIDEFAILGSDVRNTGVIDMGGGLLYLFHPRAGVRGEVRYLKGVGANGGDDGWGFMENWNYLRASIGALVAF